MMIKINLLPWREDARKLKKIQFAASIVAVILMSLLVLIILHIFIAIRISHQDKRNDYLQSNINSETVTVLDRNNKNKAVISIQSDLRFLISLKEKNYMIVKVMDELVRIIPDSVTLTKLISNADKIILFGKAKSNLQITILMENIDKSSVFKESELTKISANSDASGEEQYFQLELKQEGMN